MENCDYEDVEIYPSEVEVIYTKDSGPGGQHRNKTESCVILIHKSTNIKVKEAGKDQHKNKRSAWKRLTKRVNDFYRTGEIEEQIQERRDQIGEGFRGDKRRTYRVKDDLVIDHITGNSCSYKKFMRGNLDIIN